MARADDILFSSLTRSVPDLAAAVAEADPASPSFRSAEAPRDSLEAAQSFEHWARRGNPWRQGMYNGAF